MLNKLQNWLLKKLKATRNSEIEEFVLDNLTGKNGYIIPKETYYNPYDGDKIIIARSRQCIMNGACEDVKVAPWCDNVIISGIYKKGNTKNDTNNTEEVEIV